MTVIVDYGLRENATVTVEQTPNGVAILAHRAGAPAFRLEFAHAEGLTCADDMTRALHGDPPYQAREAA